jgi:ribonuclease PH
METALKQCYEASVELKLYPRSLISVHIMVLQSDGGLLAGASRA